MARPKKRTLDYFEVDVGIAQNLKVRKLINRKGGARALGVFMYLLCRIYKNGYYIDCNSDVIFEIAADLYEQEDYVMEVILYCMEIRLFDQGMYDRHQILTSRGIQERYAALQNQRKRISVVEQYDLLNDDDSTDDVSSEETRVSSEETLEKRHLFGGNCTKGDVSSEEMAMECSEETHDNGHNFGINAGEKVVSSEETHVTNESAKKFIFFSTVKSASDKVEGKCLTEECVPTPVGPYGESKIKAENYIIAHFAPKALERPYHDFDDNDSVMKGKQVYIMRPCMIHGPGNKGNLNLLYGVVSKGLPWPLGAFENRRSFTSIGNLCVVIEGLLTQNVPSGIYHMGDDEAFSTNELIQVICEALGKKAHIWCIPKGLMNGVAKVGGWFHLPLNPLRMQKLTENYVVSNAKIKAALGITRMPVRAKDGLMDTIRSFKQ